MSCRWLPCGASRATVEGKGLQSRGRSHWAASLRTLKPRPRGHTVRGRGQDNALAGTAGVGAHVSI